MRHVDNSHKFDPRRRLGDTCSEQLGERFTETTGDWETNVENSWGPKVPKEVSKAGID